MKHELNGFIMALYSYKFFCQNVKIIREQKTFKIYTYTVIQMKYKFGI